MRPARLSISAPIVLALATLAGCKRPEDQAAKQRIFTPEQPTGAQADSQDKLDAQRLADDGALAHRVLQMPRSEMAHRLGGYQATSKVSFSWTRGGAGQLADGGVDSSQLVALTEDAQLRQSENGDFSVKLQNDHNQGFEVVGAHGQAFVRTLYGTFRKRRTDRTDPAISREQALGGLATFDKLARGLKLRLVGPAKSGGRAAFEYAVAGTGARPATEDPRELPPPLYPEPPAGQAGKALGPDPDTARRLELREQEQPVQASGKIFIDAATGAPLAAELRGTFRVAPPSSGKGAPAGKAAELQLAVSLSSSEVGKPLEVAVPSYEPDPSAPHGVKDPLRFLGKAGSADGDSDDDETP